MFVHKNLFLAGLVSLFVSLAGKATEPNLQRPLTIVFSSFKVEDGTRGGECPGTSCSFLIQKTREFLRVTDGSLQIIIAMATNSEADLNPELVGEDAARRGFRIRFNEDTNVLEMNIVDFTNLRLRDVGVRNEMLFKGFKIGLIALLPKIKSDIEKIPNNPNIKVTDVARYIQLSIQMVE